MKKLFSLVLVLCLALILCGCGNSIYENKIVYTPIAEGEHPFIIGEADAIFIQDGRTGVHASITDPSVIADLTAQFNALQYDKMAELEPAPGYAYSLKWHSGEDVIESLFVGPEGLGVERSGYGYHISEGQQIDTAQLDALLGQSMDDTA